MRALKFIMHLFGIGRTAAMETQQQATTVVTQDVPVVKTIDAQESTEPIGCPMHNSDDYARRLKTGAFDDLVSQLHGRETLWVEAHYFCMVDCLASSVWQKPVASQEMLKDFLSRHKSYDLTIWALGTEANERYLSGNNGHYYDPFTECPHEVRQSVPVKDNSLYCY